MNSAVNDCHFKICSIAGDGGYITKYTIEGRYMYVYVVSYRHLLNPCSAEVHADMYMHGVQGYIYTYESRASGKIFECSVHNVAFAAILYLIDHSR